MADKTWIPGGPQTHFLSTSIRLVNEKSKTRFTSALTPVLMTLHRLKSRIDDMDHQSIWDEYKKITNPYEFVFLSLAKRMQYSVARKIPLSRSYYKMIEIWQSLDFINDIPAEFTTAHSAEGPGGFIEACVDIAKNTGRNLKYSLAMTLRSTDKNIPGWKKSQAFLHDNPQVEITYGEDETGNLYNCKNHEVFRKLFAEKGDKEGADLYTADGGFDFTNDFDNQEENVIQLLVSEILLGLLVLKKGGILIVKLFDTVLQPTIELMYLTTRQFREWTIIKPKTSRAANSERYLVCKGYLGKDTAILALLEEAVNKTESIIGFLNPEIQHENEFQDFQKKITDFSQILSELQIIAIKRTLHVIENKTPEILRGEIKENILHSLDWCQVHHIEINKWYKENTIEFLLEKLSQELLSSNFGSNSTYSGLYPSHKYPRGQFQLRQTPDAGLSSPFQPAPSVELVAPESSCQNSEQEAWQTTEETRSGSWETVKRQQRRNWRGEP
jgi:23S rRNA U2552 (ribose-2'-O)-methylase RlmE/FtsJ